MRIGTSGWSYPNWRQLFYPRGLKQGDWLAFYARQFATVEINASFYRLPTVAMIERWLAVTPPGFVFAIKAWRAITHEHRLADCQEQLAMFLARIEPLSAKTAAILFQLPPRFAADPERLARFLADLPAGYRYVFEFRDPSWWREDVYQLLADKGAGFACFDLAGLHSPRLVERSAGLCAAAWARAALPGRLSRGSAGGLGRLARHPASRRASGVGLLRQHHGRRPCAA